LTGQHSEPVFEAVQFFQRVQVDSPDAVDLVPQVVDLVLALGPPLLFLGRFLLLGDRRDVDAVIFADAVGQRVAFVLPLAGGQFLLVLLVFELAEAAAERLLLGGPGGGRKY